MGFLEMNVPSERLSSGLNLRRRSIEIHSGVTRLSAKSSFDMARAMERPNEMLRHEAHTLRHRLSPAVVSADTALQERLADIFRNRQCIEVAGSESAVA